MKNFIKAGVMEIYGWTVIFRRNVFEKFKSIIENG